MKRSMESLGLVPIINAAGSVTHLSASPVSADIAAAMAAAAQSCIDIADAQARANAIIAAHTGAEAGIVTSGASAGLLLGAAACLAGLDARAMDRLPDTAGMRNEFIVPRSHRNSYDHAVRAAGGRFVEAGVADRLVGVGVRDTDVWEIEGAITEKTAGFFYVARPDSRPTLPEVAAIARRSGLPLLVDAAAELPPTENLRRFIDEGADLVAFSGGKAIGGPMASGILCGRRPLIVSALLQQLDLDFEFESWQPPSSLIDKQALRCVPRNGIGRSCKVGKEQIVGLLLALEAFAGTPNAAHEQRMAQTARSLAQALSELPQLGARIVADEEGRGVPRVEIRAAGVDAQELADRLRAGSPSVRVDTTRVRSGLLQLNPTCLSTQDSVPIARAFARALGKQIVDNHSG
jgi:L-seryl-tRNA(Ser) seleniumtransferase